jgi:streptogramin lyase
MIQKIVSSAFLVFFSFVAIAQDIAIGEWKAHLPFRKGVSVTQSETEVFLAFESQIAIMDKTEFSIDKLNKVNGLSDVSIQAIKYNEAKKILVVAYENGNLDLVKESGIININHIKETLTYNDKTINHISFDGDYAYLACNFGIVQVNMIRNEIKGTFPFTDPEKVNATVVLGSKVYAFTDEGVFEGDTISNLLDFSTWRQHNETNALWQDSRSLSATLFQGVVYADIGDTLMRFVDNKWEAFEVYEWNGNSFDTLSQFYNPNYSLKYIEPNYNQNSIVISWEGKNGPARMTALDVNGTYFINYNPTYFADINQAIIDQNGRWWITDQSRGGSYLSNGYVSIAPNAPYNKGVQSLAVKDSKVWVAGGTIENWTGTGDYSGSYLLNEGFWKRYSGADYSELDTVPDHIRVIAHPTNDKIYLATFGDGVVEIDGDNITIFKENSSLQPDVLDQTKYKVSGIAFDDAGNLWCSNFGASRPISVRKTDGTWVNFNAPSQFQRVVDVVVDYNGYKWFATKSSGNGNGILVFDEGDLNIVGDERYAILTADNSELPNNDVISLAVDLDGEVWVGTSQGTALFECTYDVFNGTCSGRRVVTSANDFGDYLLKTQVINAIAIDGANRKWFGTSAGIFVQSEDGQEEVLRLNVNNSPLYSNNITALAIDDKTGEVYIGTDRGLISYKSNATKGTQTHDETTVLAYPNPVRPDYEGAIAIRGLVEEANVKITDVNGVMIYETKAYGGQAIWDGRDYNGRKAASGVYLVFSSRKDGLDAIVTKILFLN